MAVINVLDQNTINQIAAGEVIERPASVVKELIENSIDAGATQITCEIKAGGTELIRITDNGSGIEPGQIRKAFLAHATSKIKTASDLTDVMSLGFRGEALASIASVAEVEMLTKIKGEVLGTRYAVKCGEETALHDAGCPEGTTVIVKNLFSSVPVRKKFLKSPITEASYVSDLMERIALSHPEVSIKYINNGKTVIFTNGNGLAKDVIYGIYGRDITNALIEVRPGDLTSQNDSGEDIKISGFIAKPVVTRSNRSLEHFFVNGRYIRNNVISKAIEEAYSPYMMTHKYPFTVLFIEIDAEKLDVNVHPTKMEVRFSNPDILFNKVYDCISRTLKRSLMLQEVTYEKPDNKISARERVISDINIQKAPEPFETGRAEIVKAAYRQDNPSADIINMPAASTDDIKKDNVHTDINTPDEKSGGYAGESEVPYNSFSQLAFKADESKNISDICAEDSEEFKKNMLSEYVIVGQVFDTYWIVQRDRSMYIIDQHAAHEKVLYEHIVSDFTDHLDPQQLSPAEMMSFGSSECAIIEEHMEDLKRFGFELEAFSGNEYAITGVPRLPFDPDPKELLSALVSSYAADDPGKNRDITEVLKDRLATCACKAAVKGNTKMSRAEAESLLKQLMKLENPFNCPHGRPVIIEMSKNELEKKFKRIV